MSYPFDFPFVMTESITGAAICVVVDGDVVKFHDSDASAFPGPVIAEYMARTITIEESDVPFALALGDKSTWLSSETFGVVRAWVADETR